MDVVLRGYNISHWTSKDSSPIYEVNIDVIKDGVIDKDLSVEEMLEQFYADKFFKRIGLSIDKFKETNPELFL